MFMELVKSCVYRKNTNFAMLMKWKNRSLFKIYLVVIVLVGITTGVSLLIFTSSTISEMIVFVMTVVSVLIALLAYHISIKTYISIDAVNAISKMDGNVMENENYCTNVFSRMLSFKAETKEGASDELLSYMESMFSGNGNFSGSRLADNVQEMIDLIVLISFIITRTSDNTVAEDNVTRIENLFKKIDEKMDKFSELSEGTNILMQESVKLIKAVYAYQKLTRYDVSKSSMVMLFDVRGPMMKNVISRTVYYNYMGLSYLNRAVSTMERSESIDAVERSLYSIGNLRRLKEITSTDCGYLAFTYLKESVKFFNEAVSLVSNDIMWNGFIKYNLARAQFFLSRIDDGMSDDEWVSSMNEAIMSRFKINLIYADLNGTDGRSYFQRAFIDQEKQAKLMKIKFEIASSHDITDTYGKVLVKAGEYENVLGLSVMKDIGKDEFNRLGVLIGDIRRFLGRIQCPC